MKRIFLLALLVTTLACKAERMTSAVTDVRSAESPITPAAPGAAQSLVAPSVPRMVVRTADVNMVVKDATTTSREMAQLAESLGGYVTDSKVWRENEQVRASLTMRVPAAKLNGALESIRKAAVRIDSESVRGEDVTQEYTDLNARLTNLEAAEKELRELLATVREKTQKAADVMEVYEQLTEVRGEIEQIRGRMQLLSQQTALSTVNLLIIPDVLAQPVVEPGWRPVVVAREAARSLAWTMQALANGVIWALVYLLPIALLLIGVILILRALLRGLSARIRRNPPEAPSA